MFNPFNLVVQDCKESRGQFVHRNGMNLGHVLQVTNVQPAQELILKRPDGSRVRIRHTTLDVVGGEKGVCFIFTTPAEARKVDMMAEKPKSTFRLVACEIGVPGTDSGSELPSCPHGGKPINELRVSFLLDGKPLGADVFGIEESLLVRKVYRQPSRKVTV